MVRKVPRSSGHSCPVFPQGNQSGKFNWLPVERLYRQMTGTRIAKSYQEKPVKAQVKYFSYHPSAIDVSPR